MRDAGSKGIWFALLTQKCTMKSAERLRWGGGCTGSGGAAQQSASLFSLVLKAFSPKNLDPFIVNDQIMKTCVPVKLVEISHTARKH